MKSCFNNKILILGFGAVSRCFYTLLIRHVDINFSQVTIIDALDYGEELIDFKERGGHFVQATLTEDNYAHILSAYLSAQGLLIDLSVNFDSGCLIQWCQDQQVLYLNASLEWPDASHGTMLYEQHRKIRQQAQSWAKGNSTAIIEHGANPGLVTYWTKQALEIIAQNILEHITIVQERKKQLEKALAEQQYAQLAYLTNTKIIQIAERDSQITHKPKKVNEFVNTWSIDALYEESCSPAEIGWGTHEHSFPPDAHFFNNGPSNQIYFKQAGMNLLAKSWVPSGDIIGMLIRHGEAFSISDYLTVFDNFCVVYRPSVYYVYLPADVAWCSLHEMKMHNYTLQPNKRVLSDDIVSGYDELGVLLLGHDLNGWWIGSQLSIEQTRELVGSGHNATTLQVAASLLGALLWIINNPKKGFCTAEDIPWGDIMPIANMYLGSLISQRTLWQPNKLLEPADMWQFKNFRC